MVAMEMRQGAKFYGKIGTDRALSPGEGNLIGCTLGQIGRSWFGNYDPDYFKDCPSALRTTLPRRAKDGPGAQSLSSATPVRLTPRRWRFGSPGARVGPIDRGSGIDTLPANADHVPGEGSINQHLDDFALRHVLRQACGCPHPAGGPDLAVQCRSGTKRTSWRAWRTLRRPS